MKAISLNERFLDSKYLQEIYLSNKFVIYELYIPDYYHPDIELIIKGRYSKVSAGYKEMIKVHQKYCTKWKSEMANYLIAYNVPFSILVKGENMRDQMMEVMQIKDFDISQEFYLHFDHKKEILI